MPAKPFLRRGFAPKPSQFQSIAWSPDGRQLAAAATDGCI